MTSTKKNIDPLIVDPRTVAPDSRSAYPPPFDEIVRGRHRHRLSPVTGLKKFGVNLVRLEPGSSSSARHWHTEQDEFVYVVAGTATLVTDDGETEMGPGMAAGFPAGNPNGHQVVNRGNEDVWYLEVGDRPQREDVIYSDVDMANAV
ncbi:MAG: cupin domain-containing protein, partial [Alphaproteobacteria bacterium]|nr:cupin domain-containing protein [Alphaproteobacteria bacterium]